MKHLLLIPPLAAALVFTLPQALENFQEPAASYVPVVYELLMLLFSFVAAFMVNGVVLLPLNWLVIRLWSGGFLAGLFFGFLIALSADIVAYAFEVFDYQSSIFHPAYLYRIFLPLLPLACLNFWYLARYLVAEPEQESGTEEPGSASEDA
jgi:hypothetical protein